MQLILLTHPRELERKTNTGNCVLSVAGVAQRVIWQRTEPNAELLADIARGDCALLYPGADAESATTERLQTLNKVILLDATWQEARKIYNRSSYLQALRQIKLTPAVKTEYQLRRNQIAGGLCTAECAIELFSMIEQKKITAHIQRAFNELNTRNSV